MEDLFEVAGQEELKPHWMEVGWEREISVLWLDPIDKSEPTKPCSAKADGTQC